MLKKLRRFMDRGSRGVVQNRRSFGILLFVFTMVAFFVLAARMTYIVLFGKIQGVDLGERTEQLYKGSSVIKAKRGAILDRNGNSIAESAASYSLYAVLSETYQDKGVKLYAQKKNFAQLAEILHKELGMEVTYALERLNDDTAKDGSPRAQVEFGSQGKEISVTQKNAIEHAMEEAEIRGLYFTEHASRLYPNGKFASELIGKTSVDEFGNLIGNSDGIEAAYNATLAGEDGEIAYRRDISGNIIPGTGKVIREAKDGQDIYTTLDMRVQSYLETLLDKVVEHYKPETMMATLMEAETGDILAMSQRPTFNPDTNEYDKDYVWRNFLVGDMYEPGSTMKLFTTAASVDTGQFNPNATYTAGEIEVYDRVIRDHDYEVRGNHELTFRQALAWSSNVGMVNLEEALGKKFVEYQQRFMFGESTNSGLLNENAGLLPDPNSPVDEAMSSFGQAINVTSEQMMRAFSSIANDGVMLQPHYISKMVDPNTHTEKKAQPEIVGKPIQTQTSKDLLTYMVDVAEDPVWGSAHRSTGPIYNVPNMHISVKTGTAEVGKEDGSGYREGETDYTYSVVIMAPAEDPKYILYLAMKCPIYEGTNGLADIANPLMKRIFDSEETILPESAYAQGKVEVMNLEGKKRNEAAKMVRKAMLNPVIIGEGTKIEKQSTPIGKKLLPNQKILLKTDGDMVMPDIYGFSKEDLKKMEDLCAIRFEMNGEGTVVSQSVPTNTVIKIGQTITVTLSG